MITYEEAFKIAKQRKELINRVVEYEAGYIFSHTDDAHWHGGYGHTPIVVIKEDGSMTTIPVFLFQMEHGKKLLDKYVNDTGNMTEDFIDEDDEEEKLAQMEYGAENK